LKELENKFSKLKEKAFLQVSKKITAIGLLKDEVIPAKNIMETLNSKKINFQFHMLDFPYKYSHENPFPVFNHEQSKLVDKSFEMIFSNVAHILK